MDKLLKRAMIDADVNNAAELSRLSGVEYQSVKNALNGKDAKLSNVVKMFSAMGFELKYVEKA